MTGPFPFRATWTPPADGVTVPEPKTVGVLAFEDGLLLVVDDEENLATALPAELSRCVGFGWLTDDGS